MKNLFTFKKDLWDTLTLNNPTLLSEATMQKINAITYYLEGELQVDCKLSDELTEDIRMLFITKVWHYQDAEDFELSIEVMLSLLAESLESECIKCGYHNDDVALMSRNIRELVCCVPESLKIHESKIRAMVIHSYIVEKFAEMGCPYDVASDIVPSLKDIERRLMMDAFCRGEN